MDVARFGDYATSRYTDAKVRENYGRRFRITFPNEFLAELCGLSVAGPGSRALLEPLSEADVLAHGMGFMSFVESTVGAAPVWCGRVSFSGDLGYELWMPARYQCYVYLQMLGAGEGLGLRHFGLHALNSLRLDKDFIGRDALERKHAADGPGRKLRLCTWTVESEPGRAGVDASGDEPIFYDGEVVGWATSGGYAHHSEKSVAMGYVLAELRSATGRFEIEILGRQRETHLVEGCLWDRHGERMRS